MRVLAATTGGTGHFGPLVPLLQACRSAGHDVVVACPDSFVGQVAPTSLACAPFDDAPVDEMGAVFARLQGLSYDEGNAIVVGEVFATLDANAALPRLSATIEQWRPDVVVRDPAEFASRLVAQQRSLPHVRVSIGLLSSEPQIAGIAAPALAVASEKLGLSESPTAADLVAGPVVAVAPERFDPPAGQSVHRYGTALPPARGEPSDVPAGDEPLVYVTFGTVAASVGLWPRAYRPIVDALADLPVRVLVTTGAGVDAEELGPLPPRTAVAAFVPQDDVLAHTAVMVTHGGFGTVLGGLRAGVPMAVAPMFADQADNAGRVASVGAGISVQLSSEPMDVRPELGAAVREAVARLLLDDETRAAAHRLSAEMASQPPVEAAVAVLRGALQH